MNLQKYIKVRELFAKHRIDIPYLTVRRVGSCEQEYSIGLPWTSRLYDIRKSGAINEWQVLDRIRPGMLPNFESVTSTNSKSATCRNNRSRPV